MFSTVGDVGTVSVDEHGNIIELIYVKMGVKINTIVCEKTTFIDDVPTVISTTDDDAIIAHANAILLLNKRLKERNDKYELNSCVID